MENYRRAIEFAAKAHHGQFRKGTEIPYIVHPFEVGHILTLEGAEEDIVCAGFLHDVLEDTSVTFEELEHFFGRRIATIVDENSEDKGLSWEERKTHTVLYLKSEISPEARLVACADKLSNIRSIQADYEICGEGLWSRFKRGKVKQQWYYGNVIEALHPLSALPMYRELCRQYERVFLQVRMLNN